MQCIILIIDMYESLNKLYCIVLYCIVLYQCDFRQLQEKCLERRRPLFIAFIDLTKAFDLSSRRGLFNLLEKIGCPPNLLSVISSFHNNMKGTVNYDVATSEPFEIRSGVKQGYVLAPTLFSIFFSMMLSHAFKTSTEVSTYIQYPTVSCLTLPD